MSKMSSSFDRGILAGITRLAAINVVAGLAGASLVYERERRASRRDTA